jgi:DNA-binding NarL/FixJ family response regulator
MGKSQDATPCQKVMRAAVGANGGAGSASSRRSSGRRFSKAKANGRPLRDPAKRLRVLGVDRHEVVHLGFRTLLTAEEWVERYLAASSCTEAMELAQRYEPHVAVVDITLGSESGAELCDTLCSSSPITRVLLLASGSRGMSVHAARDVGASGIVPKDWSIHDIAGAVRMVGLGMTLFVPVAQTRSGLLSERELEVLDLIGGGRTNKEIADTLYLSPHTVKDHTRALYRKIGARNRAEAILRAQRLGLLS